MESGESSLGGLRGQQIGIYNAYKAIRKDYPEAAAAILERFGMDRKGDISLTKLGDYYDKVIAKRKARRKARAQGDSP